MSWFWNAFQGTNNTKPPPAPALTRQTSVRLKQFETGTRRTGSLVLNQEDLKVINLQNRIERVRRKVRHLRLDHEAELQAMRNLKENLKSQMAQRLQKMEDDEVYQGIVQSAFLQDNLKMANPGDGIKEVQIVKEIHRSELQDSLRGVFQQQASDELMEVYKTGPKIKERMGEREAKFLSVVFQKDALNSERKALQTHCVEIQKKMIDILKVAAEVQFKKHYEAIRAGTLEDPDAGDLVERRSLSEARSYSSRVLAASPETKTRQELLGMKDVILEDEDKAEQRFGEVQTNTQPKPSTDEISPVGSRSPATRLSNSVPTMRVAPGTRPGGTRSTGTRSGATSRTGNGRPASGTSTTAWERNRSSASATSRPGVSSSAASRRGLSPNVTSRATTSDARRPTTRAVGSRATAARSPARRPQS